MLADYLNFLDFLHVDLRWDLVFVCLKLGLLGQALLLFDLKVELLFVRVIVLVRLLLVSLLFVFVIEDSAVFKSSSVMWRPGRLSALSLGVL